jgi:hypothetical protein
MARQVGPQERKPEHSRVLKARGRDEDVLGELHHGPQASACIDKAAYKTAASTLSQHHIQISLANRAVSI